MSIAKLSEILTPSARTPYTRPPPLRVKVVVKAEFQRARSYTFDGQKCTANMMATHNFGLCDGETVTRATGSRETFEKIEAGHCYILRNVSANRKDSGTYIFLGAGTQLFRTGPIEVSPELSQAAQDAVLPPSKLYDIAALDSGTGGLCSVEGEITSISEIRKIGTGKAVPLVVVQMKKDSAAVEVLLWRETALRPLHVGDEVLITHLRGKTNDYGFKMSSTQFTEIRDAEATAEVEENVVVLDALKGEKEIILLTEGVDLHVGDEFWTGSADFDSFVQTLPRTFRVKFRGHRIRGSFPPVEGATGSD